MKKIAYKMISSIVPIVVAALLVVSIVAVQIARTQLVAEVEDNMETTMESVEYDIQFLLSEPENITKTLAKDVGGCSDPGEDLSYFETSVTQIVEESDYIVAIGFFMDPVAWTGSDIASNIAAEEPDEETVVEETIAAEETAEEEPASDEETSAEEVLTEETSTEDASTEEVPTEEPVVEETTASDKVEEAGNGAAEAFKQYGADNMINYYWAESDGKVEFTDIGQDTDLRNTEWWIALLADGGVYYTETYVDTTLGILMTSFVVPIYDAEGTFIGCVNTDINMSAVQDVVSGIQVGDTGHCMLITQEGQYLTGASEEMILNEDYTIYNDEDTGLSACADEILTNDSFEGQISGSFGSFYCYTAKFNSYDWILITIVEEEEINAAVNTLTTSVLILSLIAIIVCVVCVILLSRSISKPIIAVENQTKLMADGDFTMEPLKVAGKDEIAGMTEALNLMLEANRREMTDISQNSNVVSNNSATLQNAVHELESSFREISESITHISSAMMDNNATTEELTASVAEVKDAVENLAAKAKESEKMSAEIMDRAQRINKDSNDNFDNAMTLTKQYESQLNESIENSKVVEEIGIMADAINDIASQINLLSLNASIEAARAGEAGRGFAVVATEIGNLATQTSSTVANIQDTIVKVRAAVTTLANNSGQIIKFINDSVTPDYKSFVDVSVQYEQDAVDIKELSQYVSDIAETLSHTMIEFNMAIQNIAEMSQSTTEDASAVLNNVDVVSENVSNVDNISNDQLKVSQELDDVVARYKL